MPERKSKDWMKQGERKEINIYKRESRESFYKKIQEIQGTIYQGIIEIKDMSVFPPVLVSSQYLKTTDTKILVSDVEKYDRWNPPQEGTAIRGEIISRKDNAEQGKEYTLAQVTESTGIPGRVRIKITTNDKTFVNSHKGVTWAHLNKNPKTSLKVKKSLNI